MAINNNDRLYGSGVDCIDIGSGGFACSNGVVYDGLTDQYKNDCYEVRQGDRWVIKCSHSGTYDHDRGNYNVRGNVDSQGNYGVGATVGHSYDNGKGNWNVQGDYSNGGNYGIGAGVSHSFGQDDRGEWNVNGRADNQGNYGVGAGLTWRW